MYCLKNLDTMHHRLLQAFLCQDQMGAEVLLTRTTTTEQMIRVSMNTLISRFSEAHMEPSRLLQRIYNRRRNHLMNLTLQGGSLVRFSSMFLFLVFFFSEQENFISSLMFHVSSFQLMIRQCQFNEHHTHFTCDLQKTLQHLDVCQTSVISGLMSSPIISREQLDFRRAELEQAYKSVRHAYMLARLHRVEYLLEFGAKGQSDDILSHAFFLFQLGSINRLLIDVTAFRQGKSLFEQIKETLRKKRTKKRRTLKEYFTPQWPRLASAFKSMIIIGVGSIFVMVPRLASTFENGQWILIALCMTQGDTVGGAVTTMKMRLVGTLLGKFDC